MIKKTKAFLDFLSSPQKKHFFIAVGLMAALALAFRFSQNPAPASVAAKTDPGIALDRPANTPAKNQKPNRDRLLKLHLLRIAQKRPLPVTESRNIFLAANNAPNIVSDRPGPKEETPAIPTPGFPYKFIGKVKIQKSNALEELAIFSSGSGNIYVKEGDMIDSDFKLLKINDNDADVQYVGNAEIIKIPIKGR